VASNECQWRAIVDPDPHHLKISSTASRCASCSNFYFFKVNSLWTTTVSRLQQIVVVCKWSRGPFPHYFASQRGAKYVMSMSVTVCLSVSFVYLSTRINRKPDGRTSIFVHVACGRGAVLWQRCDTLCTSVFMDDVTFSYNGANGPESSTMLCLKEFARWRYQSTSDNYSVCLVQFVRMRHRGEVSCLRLPCLLYENKKINQQ